MKVFALLILFLASHAWGANAQLVVGAPNPPQFSFEESETGDKLTIHRPGVSKAQIINYKSMSIIQSDRIHIDYTNNKGAKKTIDVLVEVLFTGDRTQQVQVFVPVRTDDVFMSSQVNPICRLDNWGTGLYADNPVTDLPKVLSVSSDASRVSLNVLIQKDEHSEKKWVNCFTAGYR